jgi:hypothetical protein
LSIAERAALARKTSNASPLQLINTNLKEIHEEGADETDTCIASGDTIAPEPRPASTINSISGTTTVVTEPAVSNDKDSSYPIPPSHTSNKIVSLDSSSSIVTNAVSSGHGAGAPTTLTDTTSDSVFINSKKKKQSTTTAAPAPLTQPVRKKSSSEAATNDPLINNQNNDTKNKKKRKKKDKKTDDQQQDRSSDNGDNSSRTKSKLFVICCCLCILIQRCVQYLSRWCCCCCRKKQQQRAFNKDLYNEAGLRLGSCNTDSVTNSITQLPAENASLKTTTTAAARAAQSNCALLCEVLVQNRAVLCARLCVYTCGVFVSAVVCLSLVTMTYLLRKTFNLVEHFAGEANVTGSG